MSGNPKEGSEIIIYNKGTEKLYSSFASKD
jgi:hypothetical protein